MVVSRRSAASSSLFWIVAVMLATVALLVGWEECRPPPDTQATDKGNDQTQAKWTSRQGVRTSHDDRAALPHQGMSSAACLARHQRQDSQHQGKSEPDQIAQRIVLLAKICLEYIDDYKEDFAYHVLSMSWREANTREPPKLCETGEEGCPEASEVYFHEPYLAVVPSTVPVVPVLNTELLKSYYLLQHYAVALQHLALDQQFFFDDVTYREYIGSTSLKIEDLLYQLLIDIEEQGLSPDAITTQELSKEVYRREWISNLWRKRDFVFLRDTWAGLLYVRDTFTAVQVNSKLL